MSKFGLSEAEHEMAIDEEESRFKTPTDLLRGMKAKYRTDALVVVDLTIDNVIEKEGGKLHVKFTNGYERGYDSLSDLTKHMKMK